ncbi:MULTISPECIES: hypothetical protein [Halalkalicoccus]|uniref:hypothetical protein n=1 Tax=Halalkalicoccus TaxID=332246 RepID=UPI00300EDAC3
MHRAEGSDSEARLSMAPIVLDVLDRTPGVVPVQRSTGTAPVDWLHAFSFSAS